MSDYDAYINSLHDELERRAKRIAELERREGAYDPATVAACVAIVEEHIVYLADLIAGATMVAKMKALPLAGTEQDK